MVGFPFQYQVFAHRAYSSCLYTRLCAFNYVILLYLVIRQCVSGWRTGGGIMNSQYPPFLCFWGIYTHDTRKKVRSGEFMCVCVCVHAGIILGMGSASERRRHIVTSSLIGGAHT